MILLIEILVVSLLFADTIQNIVGRGGSAEILHNAELVDINISQLITETVATVFPISISDSIQTSQKNSSIYLNQVNYVTDLAKYIGIKWDATRYGTGSVSGIGLLAHYSDIDKIVRSTCPLNETKQPFTILSCDGVNAIIEQIIDTCIMLTKQESLLTIDQLGQQVLYLQGLENVATVKLQKALSLFTRYKGNSGIPIDLPLVFTVAILFILLMTYPLYNSISSLMSINYYIRQLLTSISYETIESIPKIKTYIETGKIVNEGSMSNKIFQAVFCCFITRAEDDTALSIIDAANDSVVLCTQSCLVSEVNKIMLDMFNISSEDIIGRPFSQLFDKPEEVRQVMDNVLQTGNGAKREFMGKKKNQSTFPVFLSMGTGMVNNKKMTVSFIKDMTVEKKQSELLRMEQKRAEDLLLNILPARIANRLKNGETTIAEQVDDVTILFTDIVGFTTMSSTMSASKLVELLNVVVKYFDDLAIKYNLEKIKTVQLLTLTFFLIQFKDWRCIFLCWRFRRWSKKRPSRENNSVCP